jgi:retron-type reverse transcriptase
MLNIKSTKHLSKRLGLDIETIENVYKNIHSHCSLMKIKTKKGKIRLIASTSDLLKKIQKAILAKLLSGILLHPSAHGAVIGKSSKTNALKHCGQRCTYCLDLKSCFPNIHSTRVRRLFEETLGCSPPVATILTGLTTFNFQLAQGFSTSSAILNLICVNLDQDIEKYISNKMLTYTRYIDDITISGSFISEHTREQIKQIIIGHGFILNIDKEIYSAGDKAPSVTGINTSGKTLKVPRRYKRNLRAEKMQARGSTPQDPINAARQAKSISGKENYIRYIESM